jgi:hypothetical protein
VTFSRRSWNFIFALFLSPQANFITKITNSTPKVWGWILWWSQILLSEIKMSSSPLFPADKLCYDNYKFNFKVSGLHFLAKSNPQQPYIKIYFFNIQMKQLQRMTETDETFRTYTCSIEHVWILCQVCLASPTRAPINSSDWASRNGYPAIALLAQAPRQLACPPNTYLSC